MIPEEIIDSRIKDLRIRAEKCRSDIEANRSTLVAVVGSVIVGFCVYGRSRNQEYEDSGEIYALYVLSGYQDLGIGKALFSEAGQELVAQGYHSMILNCLEHNPSMGFYQHMSGRLVGQRQDELMGSVITENILFYENLEALGNGTVKIHKNK